jgi:hypothetical protein
MPIPSSAKPILGSFETIAKDVASQIKQVPKDVAQKALESVGVATGGSSKQVTPSPKPDTMNQPETMTDWQKFSLAKDQKTKKEIARSALQALSASANRGPQEDDYARRMREEDQKKQAEIQKRRQLANSLPMPKGKPKPGSMYGVKQKTTAIENKATKSD